MNIREKYKQILHQIEEICDEINLTQSDNLLKIIKMTKLKDKFNCIDFFDNVLYIYHTLARKHIMDRFCDEMNEFGYRCFYVNKKRDQQNKQINCGLRSLLWLLFVQRYGIKQASKI